MWFKTEKSVDTTPSSIDVSVETGMTHNIVVWVEKSIVMTLTRDEANCLATKLGFALEEVERGKV